METWRHVSMKEDVLNFKLSIRMGIKGDLSDCGCGRWADVFQKLLNY